jgi:hypothetical protein
LILGASITLGISHTVVRYIFWIGLALVVAAVSRNGLEIVPIACVVGGLVLIAALARGGRATLAACRDSLADSAKSALTVGMACAIVGTIIGMMTQTGVGTIFGGWIIGLGAKSLFLALVMTMLLSILLGTGIPTIPTYIITAALAAPALAKLGVPLIASHMFAFYYGIMADSLAAGGAGRARGGADRKGKPRQDRLGGDADRARGLRHPVHLRLLAGPDAAGGRPHGRSARLLRRGGAGDVQGAGRDRPVRRRRDRLPVHAADLARDRGSLSSAALCLLGEFAFSDTIGFRADGSRRALAMAAACAQRGGGGVSLCLASAGVVKILSVAAFTLVWTHSIEKVDWQEDWRIMSHGLELVQARVKGSGAGMEPPRKRGWWMAGFNGNRGARRCRKSCSAIPACRRMAACHDGSCRTLSDIFGQPVGVNITTMSVCKDPSPDERSDIRDDACKIPGVASLSRATRERYTGEEGRWNGSRARRRWWWARARSVPAGAMARRPPLPLRAQGAQVFCVDRNAAAAKETVDIITGEGGKATASPPTFPAKPRSQAMVAACLKAYGRIDVLDNNVGIAEVGQRRRVDEASWDHVFAVNLKSAYFAMKHVIPVMAKQGGGSIINISSIASIRHVGISYVSYNASKAAMNQMTRAPR